MIICKFGGTSLGDGERIRHCAELALAADSLPIVVVSAMAGVTDLLTELRALVLDREIDEVKRCLALLSQRHLDASTSIAPQLELRAATREQLEQRISVLDERVRIRIAARGSAPALKDVSSFSDDVVATGEDLAAILMAAAIRALGSPARVVDARRIIRTNSAFGEAVPQVDVIPDLVRAELTPIVDAGEVAVLQGFIGSDGSGRTTTMGRGGSDLTAAILGGALALSEIQIWTDVDGLLSGDPRRIDGTTLLPELGFEEAVELSYFGGKVIHPGAAKHALAKKVSIWIRNSFNPSAPGTLIHTESEGSTHLAAVAHKSRVVLIKVRARPSSLEYGFLARVFEILARHELAVDLVATSHSSTAFTVDVARDIQAVVGELADFADVKILPDLATVTVVGRGLMAEVGVNARVFRAVGEEAPIHLVSQASDVSLSFVVAEEYARAVVQRLHDSLVSKTDAGVKESRG